MAYQKVYTLTVHIVVFILWFFFYGSPHPAKPAWDLSIRPKSHPKHQECAVTTSCDGLCHSSAVPDNPLLGQTRMQSTKHREGHVDSQHSGMRYQYTQNIFCNLLVCLTRIPVSLSFFLVPYTFGTSGTGGGQRHRQIC